MRASFSEPAEERAELRVNASCLIQRLEKLATFGLTPEGGVNRVAFSPQYIASREYIFSLMKEAGLKIRVDEAGNIIGRHEGREPSLPPIAFGSHLDTVPNGGKYDGALGVIGALE